MTIKTFLSAAVFAVALAFSAVAQQLPSPTYKNLTLKGALSTSVTTGGSVVGPVPDNHVLCYDNQTISSGIPIKDCLRVGQNFGGPGVYGVRQAIEGYTLLTAPTGNPVGIGYYVGGSFTAQAASHDGGFATTVASTYSAGALAIQVASAAGIGPGTTLTVQMNAGINGSAYMQTTVSAVVGTTLTISPGLTAGASIGNAAIVTKGQLQGAISQSVNDAGANYFDVITGYEANITAAAGTHPRMKTWLGVINNPADAANGDMWDSAIGVSSGSATTRARVGLLFAPLANKFPIEATGTIIGAYAGPQAATPEQVRNGVDFTSVQTSGFLIGGVMNSAAPAPSTITTGMAIQGNLSGGAGETDFVNTFEAASGSFNFLQKTGSSTAASLMTIAPSGRVQATGGFQLPQQNVGGLPTCNAGAKGLQYFVNDASGAIAYRGVATGGGSGGTVVTCDGGNWLYM